jgi:starvation-inducible DNA-binding protein
MKLDIGIPDDKRAGVVSLLTGLLADEYVLYTKTRNYHWNVTGPHFNDLHKLFEAQYDALAEVVDEVAERIRALGAPTPATLAEFTKQTRLREHPAEYPDARTMLAHLLADHEALTRTLRADVETTAGLGDVGTSDFLTGLLEKHEKTAWMLRATIG